MASRIGQALGVVTTLRRAGMIAPMRPDRYLKMAAAMRREGMDFHAGFMSSGDVGYLDDAGRLFVVGRDDEMIVSGGDNVYPIEVGKTLTAHPQVAEAAVIGVDDGQYGQRLAAFGVLTPGAAATSETLKQHVRENLANYKVPREITVLDELPRGNTGKILRAGLLSRVNG
jgi:acyl-coenzyme A synthetase/AMP-(fatty) acid ligase